MCADTATPPQEIAMLIIIEGVLLGTVEIFRNVTKRYPGRRHTCAVLVAGQANILAILPKGGRRIFTVRSKSPFTTGTS